ncbi:hypothetical protein ACC771_25515, partial [Rhizobium ruizarguesonis]
LFFFFFEHDLINCNAPFKFVEKEEQRRIKEKLREEEKARREYERAIKEEKKKRKQFSRLLTKRLKN